MSVAVNAPLAGYGRAQFADEADVSRETLADFDAWYALLVKWNRTINLVSPTAMGEFWARHALDSWQVTAFLGEGDRPLQCLDLGSGAGFPGLAVAIALKNRGQGHVTLVESAGKKANFLRTVIRSLGLPATVHAGRAEALAADNPDMRYHVITARAFAPLPRLLDYAHPFWQSGTKAVLLKGQAVSDELTDAQKYWTFQSETQPSRSGPSGDVLIIQDLAART